MQRKESSLEAMAMRRMTKAVVKNLGQLIDNLMMSCHVT